jgi:hypothetical protein
MKSIFQIDMLVSRWFRPVVLRGFTVLLALVITQGCNNDEFAADGFEADLFSYFDFNQGYQGWEAGFARYPVEEQESLDMSSQLCALPASTGMSGTALCISGRNPYGDMLYFIKRQIEGLAPHTTYTLEFQFQFVAEVIMASRQSDMRVLVKVGASQIEPTVYAADTLAERGYTPATLNIDMGTGEMLKSANAVPIGEVDLSGSFDTRTFQASTTRQAFTGTTDSDGKLWLIAGFDSYSDAHLRFYVQSLFVGYKKL